VAKEELARTIVVACVETMVYEEKILRGMRSAVGYLAGSVQSLNVKNGESLDNAIWHAVTEMEYVAFLFSMIFQDRDDISEWKTGIKLEKTLFDSMLIEAQKLLNDAEKHVENGALLEAYREAYVARHYLLGFQKERAKKKREAIRKE
jgi:hypothetical protein